MKGKVFWLLLLFAALMMVLAACSKRGNQEAISQNDLVTEIDTDISYINEIERSDIAVDQDGNIYLTDTNKIHVFDNRANKTFEINVNEDLYHKIAIGEQYIYVLENKAVSVDGQESSRVMLQYDLEGNLIEEHSIKGNFGIHKMFYSGGNIFFLVSSAEQPQNRIVYYNLTDKRQQAINLENVISVSKHKDNSILICKESNHADADIIIYDYVNEKTIEDSHLHYSLPNMQYSESMDSILYMENNRIASIDLQSGLKTTIFNPHVLPNHKVFVRNNALYLINKDDKRLMGFNIFNNDEKTTNIKIINFILIQDSDLNVIADDFISKHPDVNILFEQPSHQVYDDTLRKKLMAGDGDFDIFCIRSDNAHLFIKHNTTEDLSAYPGIVKLFDDMFEGLKSLCSYNDKIFGIPISLRNNATVFQLNTSLMERERISIPSNWTWNDFYSIGKELKQKNEHYYMMQMNKHEFWFFCMQGVFDSLYVNRLENTYNHNSEEFIERLNLYKKFYDENLIYNETRYYQTGNEQNILLQFTFFPDYYSSGNFITLPAIANKKSFPLVAIEYYCVNPNSKNKELAVSFLESCISKEAQAEDKLIGGPILYKDPSIYSYSMYNNLFSEGNFYETYSEILKYSKRYETYDLINTIESFVEDFLNGNISAEEASKRIENKVRMVIEE